MPGLLENRDYYKPFSFPWAFEAYEKAQSMHWLPHESPLAEDIKDWQVKLTDDERQLLTQLFRFFTQADIDVAGGYVEKYLPRFPAPEVRMMLLAFGAAEANHIHSYSSLIDTLGIPEAEYKAFQDYQAMREKHEYYFGRETGKSIGDLMVDIAVFSAFGEGLQLFSSFALLMNFQRRGLMKGMTTIVEWSIRDETHHVESMIKLFHALVGEHPRAWTDENKKRVYEACRRMVELEDAFIDQAFGIGAVEGVTPAEAKLYIRYTADRRLMQLGLKPNYEVKTNPFDWLDEIMNLPTHTNFFEQRSTEYGKGGTEGWGEAYAFLGRGENEYAGVPLGTAQPIEVVALAPPPAPALVHEPARYHVHSKPDCPFCSKAKALLTERGLPFHFTEYTRDEDRLAFLDKLGGHRTWPAIFALDAQGRPTRFVGGFDKLVGDLDHA